MKRRLLNIGDALSQLGNAALLPGAARTNANESISGRTYREGWRWLEVIINTLFFWQRNPGHCERAERKDYQRARAKVNGKAGKIG